MTSITTFFMFDVPPKRGHTDKAARSLCPTSLLRNVRSTDVLVEGSCRDAFQAWPLDDAGGHRVVWRLSSGPALAIGPCWPIAVVFDLNTGRGHLQRRLQRHHDLLVDDR